MLKFLGILIGGGIGSLLRFFITKSFEKLTFKSKHIGTFLVNVLGSFVLGVAYSYSTTKCSILYQIIVIGLIASFTTFSAYEFDNLTLIAGQRYREFFKYALGSCIVCLMFLYVGIIVSKMIFN